MLLFVLLSAGGRADERTLSRIDELEELLLGLSSRLKGLDTGIRNLELPDAQGRALFAETVRITDLGPPPATFARPVAAPVESTDWPTQVDVRDQRSDSLRLWRPFLDTVDFFTHTKFKLVRGTLIGGEETEYASEIRFDAVARRTSGELVSAQSVLDVVWRRPAGESAREASNWRIHEWRLRSFTVTRADEPLFVETLERALPDPALLEAARRSIHEQLVTGLLRDPNSRRPHKYFDFQSLNRHPGLAIADIDRDGFDDLYVMERWGTNLLLRNRGDGTFEEAAARFGLDISAHSSSALFADFDNDGDLDAFVGRTLARTQYLVHEDGKFVDRSGTLVAMRLPFLVSSISAADVNGDGLLDVYISTYGIDADLQQDFLPREAVIEIERRKRADGHLFRNRPGPPNLLLLNLGDGRFGPSPFAATLEAWRNTFQSSWSDFDGDGDMDVYLANDFAPNQLLANDGQGRFEDVTAASGTADIGFGMGASWGDYDHDGRPDLYVTNMYSSAGRRITELLGEAGSELAPMARGNSLFRNLADGFVRVSGLEPPALLVERAGWAWGGQFIDVNNDGELDLYAPNGYYTAPEQAGVPPDL